MIFVKNFMSPHVLTVFPQTSVSQIWKILFRRHVHGLPVVDASNKLLGIVSEEDFLGKLFPGYKELQDRLPNIDDEEEMQERLTKMSHLTAKDIMNPKVIFTRPETSLMRTLSRMLLRQVRQVPVINDKNEVIGIITRADIFRGIFQGKKQTAFS